MSRLWEKGTAVDAAVLEFTVGDDVTLDARLVGHDCTASVAHARMLARCGYLSTEDAERLAVALSDLAAEHAQGQWSILPQQEDCHTAIEAHLTMRLGDLGQRIHLGRSRNDQVLTAMRLYLRAEAEEMRNLAAAASNAFNALVVRQGNLSIPGYTHLQRAMPSTVADWAGAHAAELMHSADTLDALSGLWNLCPLGSAAGYGTPGLVLDRVWVAEELGFASPQEPVTAVQLSRGKAESAFAFACTLLQGDLSRAASDLVLFATTEYGFVTLDPAFTTGSSIMPQKRNPDVFELIRAHATQANADLAAIQALTTRLSSGYFRDLQLMKAPLFRCIDRTKACLSIAAHALGGVRFNPATLDHAMTPDLYAAERAYALVQGEGISFREAYRRVAAKLNL
ncbi:MAG: argininosuccinate lyase [Chthonomonas sp.]|nr:argininosuccinate lyase [Chthonomonas sp.]